MVQEGEYTNIEMTALALLRFLLDESLFVLLDVVMNSSTYLVHLLRSIKARVEQSTVRRDKTTEDHAHRIHMQYNQVVCSISYPKEIVTELFQHGKLTDMEMEDLMESPPLRACEKLLKLLMVKPSDVYDCFLESLKKTKQDHVYQMLTYADIDLDEKFLSEHSRTIWQHFTLLIENIQPGPLLDHLFQTKVLSSRECEDIRSRTDAFEMNEALLMLVSQKSPDHFVKFIEALNNDSQEHVIEILEGWNREDEVQMRKMESDNEINKIHFLRSNEKTPSQKDSMPSSELVQITTASPAIAQISATSSPRRRSTSALSKRLKKLEDKLQVDVSLKVVSLDKGKLDSKIDVHNMCLQNILQVGNSKQQDHQESIRRNFVWLSENLDTESGLVTLLYQYGVLTTREHQQIVSTHECSRRNELLLSLIGRKSPQDVEKFTEALEKTNQRYIVQKLLELKGLKESFEPDDRPPSPKETHKRKGEQLSDEEEIGIIRKIKTFKLPCCMNITNYMFFKCHLEVCYILEEDVSCDESALREQLSDHLNLDQNSIKLTKLKGKPIYKETLGPGETLLTGGRTSAVGAIVKVEGRGIHALTSGHEKQQGDKVYLNYGNPVGTVTVAMSGTGVQQDPDDITWCIQRDVALVRLENPNDYVAHVTMQGVRVGLKEDPKEAQKGMRVKRYTTDGREGDVYKYVKNDFETHVQQRYLGVAGDDGGPIHGDGESGTLIVTHDDSDCRAEAVGMLTEIVELPADQTRANSLAVQMTANFNALQNDPYCAGSRIQFV